jgi:hypothetical protein
MKSVRNLTLVLISLFIHASLLAQNTLGPDIDSFDPSRVGFGNIGVVGNSFNSAEAVFINPARIAQGNQFAGRFGYSPWYSAMMATTDYVMFNGDLSYAFNDKHAAGISFRNNTTLPSPGPSSVENLISAGYRLKMKKGLSAGISINYYSTSRNLTLPDGTILDTRYSGFTVNLGVHKVYRTNETNKGFNQFDWGISLTEIGGAMEDNNSNFVYTPRPNLNIGLGYQRRIFLGDQGKFVNLHFAYQLQKPLYPMFFGSQTPPPGEGIFGRMLNSLSDNPDGFGGELDEIYHDFGVRASVHLDKFYFALNAGHRPDYILGEDDLLTAYGAEVGYTNIVASFATMPSTYLASVFEPDGELRKVSNPFLSLSYRIPLQQGNGL